MAGTTLDIEKVIEPHSLAGSIATKWQEWDSLRSKWLEEKRELRNYVFATDTRTTSNSKNPWSNSTTTPKLTQIYDNLKANYSAALFPNAHWMRWESKDEISGSRAKRDVIQAYMETKLSQSEFETTADRLLDDYILYGNCFATVEWVEDYTVVDETTNETTIDYIGPKAVRISPYDIVFNPTAPDFNSSPKIVRSLVSLGELKRMADAGDEMMKAIFDKMVSNRRTVSGAGAARMKADAYIADGFSSIQHYYGSGYVEVLTFYGDIFDAISGDVKVNRKIVVVDRAYVFHDEAIANWLGRAPIYHAGWRSRPDNLWAMGPLDNLVGLQYRMDHVENLRADVFDQIAFPVLKIRGDVEKFTYAPGTKIILGEEGDVVPLVPDTTALNADFQLQQLDNKMEELAGAPRQAMGIRTPGEKTAFEVQSLMNASSRIFQHKAEKYEREFLTKLLNAMLESARRNLNVSDTIRVLQMDDSVVLFNSVTKEDIKGNGTLRPVGASHFAERAQRLQHLQSIGQFRMDPGVNPHLSGKKIAEILSLELNEPALYGENIAIKEQLATQQAIQDAEAANAERLQIQQEAGI